MMVGLGAGEKGKITLRTKQFFAAAIVVVVAMYGSFTASTTAQEIRTAPLITEQMPVTVDSGIVTNDGDAEQVVFSHTIFIPGAAALRLEFDRVLLAGFVSDGSGSVLRIRSLFDGAEQRLDARHVEQWQNTSAYFNGDEVVIEIVAKPGTGENTLRMSVVQAQFEPFVDRSICGPTDDRVPSTDNRIARLLPIGCTGWLIDDCNSCFLTAGHCSERDSDISVVQFNVPFSDSDGTLNHPPPEDQYAVDVSSRQSNDGQGVGNDYAYFGVFPNSNTGLTPAEAYGEVFRMAMPPPVDDQDIRITGYGVTGSGVPREWYQTQKTHEGPYFSFSGTTLSYQTDTTGGNSGSPVVNDETGKAIGIHTHAGCGSSSGNKGTGINHNGLQNFLANPKGVCDCPLIDFFFPEGLPDYVDPAGGSQILVEVLPNGDSEPESGTGMFYVDTGDGYVEIEMDELEDNVYLATFPEIDCGTTVRYYFSAETDEDELVYEPLTAPIVTFDTIATLGVELVLVDDFETENGWTVRNERLQTGSWDREVPANGGSRGDPGSDFDGSGRCWVTGNDADEDIDGGPTRLMSPAFDFSAMPGAVVSYARWFTNDDRDGDRLTVEVSNNDGATWTVVESVSNTVGWVEASFAVADFVIPTSAVRVRFSATDNPNDSVTEAAIDAFRIYTYVCSECAADFNGDGEVNSMDVFEFLNAWNDGDSAADFDRNGEVDTQDMIGFLNAWNIGC